jgi:hypothetical protein
MADDGSIILANIGMGTIQKLYPDGYSEELLCATGTFYRGGVN